MLHDAQTFYRSLESVKGAMNCIRMVFLSCMQSTLARKGAQLVQDISVYHYMALRMSRPISRLPFPGLHLHEHMNYKQLYSVCDLCATCI